MLAFDSIDVWSAYFMVEVIVLSLLLFCSLRLIGKQFYMLSPLLAPAVSKGATEVCMGKRCTPYKMQMVVPFQ